MKGKDAHINRLKKLSGGEIIALAVKTLKVGTDKVRSDAHHSIMAGSVSGKGHVPSKPGEAPNNEFGDLVRGLSETPPKISGKEVTAEVISAAAHSKPLEFGTSKMQPRPHMRPARDKNVDWLHRLFTKGFRDLVKRSGG